MVEASKKIPDRFNQVVFSSSGLSFWNQVRLEISLRQFPGFVSPNIASSKISIKKDLRESIKLPQSTSKFESILNDLIMVQIPSSYLEDYSAMQKKSLEAFPKNPKVIFTAYDFALNEGFKFLEASLI